MNKTSFSHYSIITKKIITTPLVIYSFREKLAQSSNEGRRLPFFRFVYLIFSLNARKIASQITQALLFLY